MFRFTRGEVWALDVDPSERRLATGSADSELRLYAIADGDASGARACLGLGSRLEGFRL